MWTTPHGLAFIVDPPAPRAIDPAQAEPSSTPAPGTEIYFAPFDVIVDLEPN